MGYLHLCLRHHPLTLPSRKSQHRPSPITARAPTSSWHNPTQPPPGTYHLLYAPIVWSIHSNSYTHRIFVSLFVQDQHTVWIQFRLFLDLLPNLLKYPLPRPGRIQYEVLQRLPVAIHHAVSYPGKVTTTFHRYLPLQIPQRMLAGITCIGLEASPIALPMLSQLRLKLLDLLFGIPQRWGANIFFTMFIMFFTRLSHNPG